MIIRSGRTQPSSDLSLPDSAGLSLTCIGRCFCRRQQLWVQCHRVVADPS